MDLRLTIGTAANRCTQVSGILAAHLRGID